MRAPRKYRVKVKILRDRVSKNIKILWIDGGRSPAGGGSCSNAPRYNTQACALRNFETSITRRRRERRNVGIAGDVERTRPAFAILEYENCPLTVDACTRVHTRALATRRSASSRAPSPIVDQSNAGARAPNGVTVCELRCGIL